jgi:phenylacetate-CoA ligase
MARRDAQGARYGGAAGADQLKAFMSRLLSLYHRAPQTVRRQAAHLRGLYLRAWRYGRETEALVEQALDRERWSPEQWERWQKARLRTVLERAATDVPFYRERRGVAGTGADIPGLDAWPLLEKDEVRRAARRFVADDCRIGAMFHDHTSGTTGKSLDLWWSRRTVRLWYALFEARCRRWHGVSRHDRWAILGGQLVVPVAERRPPFWIWNAPLNQLYMSSYHLTRDWLPAYLGALRRHRITYLLGYPSALYEVALAVLRLKRRDLQMAVAVTNAEPVTAHQRAVIEEAFQCPVRETYGMAEIVANASECHAGNLHLWPESGYVEVMDHGQHVPYGEVGELVCTGLLNDDMPLVRYRIGDRGALADPAQSCPCGRTLPMVRSIEGRSDDVLYTRDGRTIGRLDPVFKSQLPISEAQLVQEAIGRIKVRYVPDGGFTPATASDIARRIQDRMGDVTVVFEAVQQLPRTPQGKFRAVICELPAAEQRALQQR